MSLGLRNQVVAQSARQRRPRHQSVTSARLIFSPARRETLLARLQREIQMADLVSGTVILAVFLWAVLRKPTSLPEDRERAR